MIVAFERPDISGGESNWHYRAYSSNDPERIRFKLVRDVDLFLGYQSSNPTDCITDFGYYRFSYYGSNHMTYGQRSQGVLCVRIGNHDIDGEYTPVSRDDRFRLLEAGADNERIVECEHYIVPVAILHQNAAESDNSNED
jgi:hypothetical protein